MQETSLSIRKHYLIWLYHDGIKLIKHKHSAQWHQKSKNSLKSKQNLNKLGGLHYYTIDYKLTWKNESSTFQKLVICLAFWLHLLMLSLTLLSPSPLMSLDLLFLNTTLLESSSVLWWSHFLEQECYTMILLWSKIHQNESKWWSYKTVHYMCQENDELLDAHSVFWDLWPMQHN
jgi:hypothetical protein